MKIFLLPQFSDSSFLTETLILYKNVKRTTKANNQIEEIT